MMKSGKMQIIIVLILGIFLSSCITSEDAAALTVESYLEALAAQDGAGISNLSCKDWELQAIIEMDAFMNVSPTLEGLACVMVGENGEVARVHCDGKIMTTYNNEVREFDLSVRTYQLTLEGGEWRVCGYE